MRRIRLRALLIGRVAHANVSVSLHSELALEARLALGVHRRHLVVGRLVVPAQPRVQELLHIVHVST